MQKRSFGKLQGLILGVVVLMLGLLGIGITRYNLTENELWLDFSNALFRFLIIVLFMRLVFDLFLKQFLSVGYKKATLISFCLIFLHSAFDFLRNVFSDVSTLAIIPIAAPAVGFVVFYYMNKEHRVSKGARIAFCSALALVFVYSVFCEVSVWTEFFKALA